MKDIRISGQHDVPLFILARGAGMKHPFMESVTNGLAAKGIRIVRFNFPYMSPLVQVDYIPDGDHSFKPRKRSGYTEQGNLSFAIEQLSRFIWERFCDK